MRNTKRLYKKLTLAGVVLTLAGVAYGGDTQEVYANEDTSVGISGNRVELRDQTFTLGRLRIEKGVDYDYTETLPNHTLVGKAINSQLDEVTPLPEGFEGYVEVRGRIKSGNTVWLEIAVNGEPSGYISENRLEVKPITRTTRGDLPETVQKRQAVEKDTPFYSNLTFLNVAEDVLPEGTEFTVLGVYDVVYFNNKVESVQVVTNEGLTGWVKVSDIVGEEESLTSLTQSTDDYVELDNLEDNTSEDTKGNSDTEIQNELVANNPVKARLKPQTVLYTHPTYLEYGEVTGSTLEEQEVEVLNKVSDEEVTLTFYKVFTTDGREGYIAVNEHEHEPVRVITHQEEITEEVVLNQPKVLTSLPKGVVGARDSGMVDVTEQLTAIEKVEVELAELEPELELESELILEDEQEPELEVEQVLEEDELESEELESEELESEELETEPQTQVYYKLVDTLTGEDKGYALESDVLILTDGVNEQTVDTEEDSENVQEGTDSESNEEDTNETSQETSQENGQEDESGLEDARALRDTLSDESIRESIENSPNLQGWAVGQESGNVREYVAPNTATSQTTIDFINKLAPYSRQVQEGGLYPSVMIAQAILESNSGRSGLARNDNNLFGIKGSYNGQSASYRTQEANGVQFYGIQAGFRKYPDLKSGVADYVKLLNNENYTRNGVVNAQSAFHSLVGLKEAGYATDPLYIPKVWNVIDTYNLTQFD